MFEFVKMNGLGNDFVMINSESINLNEIDVVTLCDRKRGIGCDQLIILSEVEAADVKMEIYNADGSHAEVCGNALRCVAKIIHEKYDKNTVKVLSNARIFECTISSDGLVAVNMGQPLFRWDQIPLSKNSDTKNISLDIDGLFYTAFAVNMGNPHAVFFVDSLNDIDLQTLGPAVEKHPLFTNKTNVEFVHCVGSKLITRVWERGVGETLACGTGACAVFVAATRLGFVDSTDTATVVFPGGALDLSWDKESVLMKGEANTNFYGKYVYKGTPNLFKF